MGGSSGSQQTQQQTVSQPWKPAQPELKNILSGIGGINTAVTPYQQGAAGSLESAASGLPNLGASAFNTLQSLLSGAGNQGLQTAYGNMQNSLGGLANPANLNPMSNPYTGQAMGALNSDITNQINSQFAGAGRDLSPANTTALARGLSQGEGGLLMGQYNQNASNLGNAANSLFAGAQGINSANLQNLLGALGGGSSALNLALAPSEAQMGAGQAAYNLPISNLGGVEGLTLPIAGLGGQTNTQGSAQTQQNMSPFAMATGGLGLFGSQGTSPYQGFLQALPRF